MLKSKIHRATVTEANVDYEGSITIDENLMKAAGILEHEQVHVLDVTSGDRLVTYAISGRAGEICVNGAAARKISVGDTVIIASYCELERAELEEFEPIIVKVNGQNEIIGGNGFIDETAINTLLN